MKVKQFNLVNDKIDDEINFEKGFNDFAKDKDIKSIKTINHTKETDDDMDFVTIYVFYEDGKI